MTRATAEQIGPTVIRFTYPCGHSSTRDFSKGPRAKQMGEFGVRFMARYWRKENGGVAAPCPKCARRT